MLQTLDERTTTYARLGIRRRQVLGERARARSATNNTERAFDRAGAARVKAQWATLGHVDFISVIEAPDEGTMARVSLELGSRGTGRYETLSAIPIDEFIASL